MLGHFTMEGHRSKDNRNDDNEEQDAASSRDDAGKYASLQPRWRHHSKWGWRWSRKFATKGDDHPQIAEHFRDSERSENSRDDDAHPQFTSKKFKRSLTRLFGSQCFYFSDVLDLSNLEAKDGQIGGRLHLEGYQANEFFWNHYYWAERWEVYQANDMWLC